MKTSVQLTTLAALTTTVLAACSPQTLLPLGNGNQPAINPGVNSFAAAQSGEQIVPGKVLVKFRAGRGGTINSAALAQAGVQRSRSLGAVKNNLEVLAITGKQSPERVATELEKNPAIEFAEPVFTVPFPKVMRASEDTPPADNATYPNDVMFPRQYAHQVAKSQGGWAVHRGNPKVILGIVDSGLDINHVDLKAKVVGTYNSADGNPESVDHVGHGTHVAGISAALTNNTLGVAGVAPDCSILAVKVAPGNSSSPTTEGIANGILYAMDKGAQVINLSLGSRRESQAITDAVKQALARNVVVVVAMGNDSGNIKSWPAGVPGVIAVGSTDNRDQRSRFSNYGDWITVTAPGSDILSTFPLNTNLIGQKEYGAISGTSMAAPFVTGLAGLIRSKYPGLSNVDVKRAIEMSSDDLGKPGFDPEFGFGRVNVAKALSRAGELAVGAARR
jgi:subtilisin family serine protease